MIQSVINILEKVTFGAFVVLVIVWVVLKSIYIFVKGMRGY